MKSKAEKWVAAKPKDLSIPYFSAELRPNGFVEISVSNNGAWTSVLIPPDNLLLFRDWLTETFEPEE